jgi:3-phosphoshikimate 1-carboxyvinyltransferase
MGADIIVENEHTMSGEPVADINVRHAELKGVTVDDPARIVSIIDELPLLAVVATQAVGETTVRGAGELRAKESDRIKSTVQNLTVMGADIDELKDGFVVRGPTKLKGVKLQGFGDHRIAMAMTVAGDTILDDDSVVAISYPEFYNDLRAIIR